MPTGRYQVKWYSIDLNMHLYKMKCYQAHSFMFMNIPQVFLQLSYAKRITKASQWQKSHATHTHTYTKLNIKRKLCANSCSVLCLNALQVLSLLLLYLMGWEYCQTTQQFPTKSFGLTPLSLSSSLCIDSNSSIQYVFHIFIIKWAPKIFFPTFILDVVSWLLITK